MTTIEKMKAMNAAFTVMIGIDVNDQWYASGPEQGGDGLLASLVGRGTTPEAAVDDLWKMVTSVPTDRHLRTYNDRRVRWNGFMWQDVHHG